METKKSRSPQMLEMHNNLDSMFVDWAVDVEEVSIFVETHSLSEIIEFLDFLNFDIKIPWFEELFEMIVSFFFTTHNWIATMLDINIRDSSIIKFLNDKKKVISKLKELNSQLSMNWWNPLNVAKTLGVVKNAVSDIQSIRSEILWNPNNDPLVIEELSWLSKELSWVQFQIDQINAMSYSDLWELWKQRWWKLAQRSDTTDVMIVDTKTGKVVLNLLGNDPLKHQYTCIVSTDEDTIATSVWVGVKLWYVDKTKWDGLITWESEWTYINLAMSQLASKILKQWFSWKLEHIWNGYFKIGYLTSFFDNKWNILSDKSWKTEFVDSFTTEYVIENGRVVKKDKFSNLKTLGNTLFWEE